MTRVSNKSLNVKRDNFGLGFGYHKFQMIRNKNISKADFKMYSAQFQKDLLNLIIIFYNNSLRKLLEEIKYEDDPKKRKYIEKQLKKYPKKLAKFEKELSKL